MSRHENINDTPSHTKPAFLQRVRIRGYKSIDFCDVPLQPLTILVGRNAAGKSNFLGAIAFLRDVLTFGVGLAVRMRGGWKNIACCTSTTEAIEIEIEAGYVCGRPTQRLQFENGGNTAFSLPKQPKQLPNLEQHRISARYLLRIVDVHAPLVAREILEITDQTTSSTGGFELQRHVPQQLVGNTGSGAATGMKPNLEVRDGADVLTWTGDNTWFDVSKLVITLRSDFCLLSILGMQPFLELAEGLWNMGHYSFHPDSIRKYQKPSPGNMLERDGHNLASVIEGLKEIDPTSVERVRDYLKLIVPELDSFDVVRFGEIETIQFRLRQADGSLQTFDASSMSDGTLRALAALMAAFQIHLPSGPSVIGIEEPETALHPAAMRALVDALDEATQRVQVLLTTHSADLLSGRDVQPGQVLVVRNRGGKTQITPLDAASQEIIRKELYTLADLQRMDKLDLDEADLRRQAQLRQQGE